MIPKIIWQTYECEYQDLPNYIKEFTYTWINKNPDWEYRYMSGKQREIFILDNFGNEWLDIYNSYPYRIMKSDIWRYMVLYVYGGFYVDLDTKCIDPIIKWLPKDKNFIVSIDYDYENFSNGYILSCPRSPIMLSVLEYIKNKPIKNKYRNKVHEVYLRTGPQAFSEGIRNSLDLQLLPSNDYLIYNECKKAIDYGFYCLGGEEWDIFNGKSIYHETASKNWTDQYLPWQIIQE